jgi:hypothetical protein
MGYAPGRGDLIKTPPLFPLGAGSMVRKRVIEIPEHVYEWLEEHAKTTNKTIEEALASMLIPYYWVWEEGWEKWQVGRLGSNILFFPYRGWGW